MTDSYLVLALKEDARGLGVTVDESMEEIQRAYYERVRESPQPWFIQNYDCYLRNLKAKKACEICKGFFCALHLRYARKMDSFHFCSDECLNFYKLKSSALQQVTNQWKQNNITHEKVFNANLLLALDYEDLFQVNRVPCCIYENDPIFHPAKAFHNHIQNCLTTREKVESFKNEMLRIIQAVVQNRSEPMTRQTTQTNASSTPSSSNYSNYSSDSYSSPSSYSSSTSDSSDYSSSTSNSNAEETKTKPSSSTKTENNPQVSEEKKQNTKANPALGSGSLPTISGASTSAKSSSSPSTSVPRPARKQTSDPLKNQEDPLTKQKQQIIQEIQTELKQLPNLNSTELANWKQEIEQMTSLEAVKAYQKNLLKKLEEKNQLRQEEVEIDSVKGNKDNKSIGWMMGVGVLLLASGLAGYLFWKKKRANK